MKQKLILSPIFWLVAILTLQTIAEIAAAQNTLGKNLQVTRITPSGEDAEAGRQIVIAFDRPVVPLGRMERGADELPIEVTPKLDCQWRWLEPSTLACQLGSNSRLTPATKYRLGISANSPKAFLARDGSKLGEDISHEFITVRPKVKDYWFNKWKGPSWPVVGISFHEKVKKESLLKRLLFVDASGNKFPVNATEDKYRSGIVWSLEPRSELPEGASLSLRVSPGIMPVLGTEAGIEDRTVVEFDTFGAFGFMGIRCRSDELKQTLQFHSLSEGLLEETLASELPACDPTAGIELVFSSPTNSSETKKGISFRPDLAGGREDFDPWANSYSRPTVSYYHKVPHKNGAQYYLGLRGMLKAETEYSILAGAKSFQDNFSRSLSKDINYKFRTTMRPPRYHFGGLWGVLEKEVDTHLPIFVTNLKALELKYSALTTDNLLKKNTKTLSLPEARNISYAYPLKVRELLKGRSGVVFGNFSAKSISGRSISGTGSSRYFSQVTPFHVHFKFGHFSSLAWVTDLSSGKPVSDAKVEIIVDKVASLKVNRDIKAVGKTNSSGLAELPGIESLDPKLKYVQQWDSKKPIFFLRVEKGDDLAYLPLYQEFEQYAYRVYPWLRKRYGHLKAWGTTAQGLYKAGDTIQFKIYLRNQNNTKLIPAPKEKYTVSLLDPLGKTVKEFSEVSLNEFGAFDAEVKVPKSGAVGWYRFEIKGSYSNLSWQAMRVLVTDFSPAPFKLRTEIEGKFFGIGDEIGVQSLASLHSGGPYANGTIRVVARLSPKFFSSKHPKAKDFVFRTNPSHFSSKELLNLKAKLDESGGHETSFTVTDKQIDKSSLGFGEIFVESAVRDERGKNVSASTAATFFGRDRFVGLKSSAWNLKKGQASEISAIVVDKEGNPRGGTEIELVLEQRKTKVSKVKGAGNAYLSRYEYEWVKEATCQLESTEDAVSCEVVPKASGYYRLTAKILDTEERKQETSLWLYSIGSGHVVWGDGNTRRLEIVPEESEYRVGDKAKFLIKNPYPGAKALITLERYGVLSSEVKTLENSAEVIEVDIKKEHIPGIYLSVLVKSKRVSNSLDDSSGVDLGKPNFRLGYLRVPVIDPKKSLSVKVAPESEKFRPGDEVKVKLSVEDSSGSVPDTELAAIVIDEAVFDLIQGGQDYFDPYKGFYNLEALDLKNYNLLIQLIGQRKFEKKGANPGGGGGMSAEKFREISKYVSYWNPSIRPNKKGEAEISFKVPDNLTAWKVIVLAASKAEKMGLGHASFKVNKDTEVRSALPNQIREGDSFQARFSVMNRFEKKRDLSVTITASGGAEKKYSKTESISVKPFERKFVNLQVDSKRYKEGEAESKIIFKIKAGDAIDTDALIASVPVKKDLSLETVASYRSTTEAVTKEPIAFPKDMRTDVGQIKLATSPTVLNSLESTFDYLKTYPYSCWEQRLSKSIAAAQYLALKERLPKDFRWGDAQSLIAETLEESSSFQAPNGGMAYFVGGDQYVSPYLSAYTALGFNWLKKLGHDVPKEVEEKLHTYLSTFLRKDVQPSFYSSGMASSVRAVALLALAKNQKVKSSDFKRFRDKLPEMNLFAKAHFLSAALELGETQGSLKPVLDMILQTADESSGKLIFSEQIEFAEARIHHSSLRSNCSILGAIVSYNQKFKNPGTAKLPQKILRHVTDTRAGKRLWFNTQENIFCLNAVIDYAKAYEAVSPNYKFRVRLATSSSSEEIGESSFSSFRQPPQSFTREHKDSDPGREVSLEITKDGPGRLYHTTYLRYASKTQRQSAINSGIEIRRELSVERDGKWQLLTRKDEGSGGNLLPIEQGELVRVDLFVSIPTARNFVVVDDPIPGGLEAVNTKLKTASRVDSQKAAGRFSKHSFWYSRRDWANYGYYGYSFYHKELRHDSARFYSDYLPPGNYHLSYMTQAISPGKFKVAPTYAEEMYSPDIFGKAVGKTLLVDEAAE